MARPSNYIPIPVAASDVAAYARVWEQPLGETLHTKMNRLVGPRALHLEFDCSDLDFAAMLTGTWPQPEETQTNNLVFDHIGLVKLVDVFNQLVRLYALETGNTRVHVLVEARRGLVGVPSWWADAPCLFATYGLDTQMADVCLAENPSAAFGALPYLAQPYRLILAVGPATPEALRTDDGDAWLDVEDRQLRSLQRWEQQLSRQLAQMLAFTFDGSMYDEEAIVDALATMRGYASKVRTAVQDVLAKRSKRETSREEEVALGAVVKTIQQAFTVLPPAARHSLQGNMVTLNAIQSRPRKPQSYFAFKKTPVKIKKAPVVKKRVRRIVRRRRVKMPLVRLKSFADFFEELELGPDAPQPQQKRRRGPALRAR